ncbi:CAP domain-containing protein [Photobacterium frigidiphilum]|uniref:CAP domain-containing protein n=1 Tax=Photobacterium frigidiphilum TaxID=264736 RepID=A0A2T3JJB3_9GAMM|nr:CAP domain-containing protein [Photobacterium frigidiphilum]PSU49091.1 CAP domain-containing protein [Photobacterium frigidiphilum]
MRLISLLLISTFTLAGCGSGGSDSSDSGQVSSGANSNTGGGDSSVPDSGNNGGGTVPDSGNGSGTNPEGGGSGTNPEGGGGSTPAPDTGFQNEMLTAVNAARATQQNCGGTIMPPVPALTWDAQLEQAAYTHSNDMANYDFFSHTGSDGSSVSTRVTAQGYTWSSVGENIAAGQKDVDAVMTSWIDSPGHCLNIMSANFTQMGASFVTNSSTQYGIYWTQVFAKPRS